MKRSEDRARMTSESQSFGAAGTQLRPVPYSRGELGRSITEISRRDVGVRGEWTGPQPCVARLPCARVRVRALRTLYLMKQLDWPGLLLRRCRHSFRERKIRARKPRGWIADKDRHLLPSRQGLSGKYVILTYWSPRPPDPNGTFAIRNSALRLRSLQFGWKLHLGIVKEYGSKNIWTLTSFRFDLHLIIPKR